ncbi:MAG: hypothetical protein KatS3mg052_2299 [Candidatus Roseilinea sp.]|nr:MAG: hypothetical protein KatS3mg052_2299 [Candidatus Roseilinea sp.]
MRIGAPMIDLVVVNLYPFQKTVAQRFVTLQDAIEHIDIGGVALIRAAAKNYARVAVVCDPCDYDLVLKDIAHHGGVSLETREVLAAEGIRAYRRIRWPPSRDYLMGIQSSDAPIFALTLHKVQDLRYGRKPSPKSDAVQRKRQRMRRPTRRPAIARQSAVLQQPARPRRRLARSLAL